MSRPFHIKPSFAQIPGAVPPRPTNIISCTDAVIENAGPLEKTLRGATASSAAPRPSKEDLIAMINEHMTHGTSAQKKSLKDFLAARQCALPALSDLTNTGPSLKQCPAFETWHPLNILNEYNRLNPSERAPSTTSMFLDDVSVLPEQDLIAHAYRVEHLTKNWRRLASIERFVPMPTDPTVSPCTEDDRMRLRLRHQMMDEADRISRERPSKFDCKQRELLQYAYTSAKQELAEYGKTIETAIKRDGNAVEGAKEQAAEEDWVVVNDMDAVEDPFVVVYDQAKFRKT
ncbi:MAG: hypothetical protein Q9216_004783 [Gyalolechia sp. 2 TL-2023]